MAMKIGPVELSTTLFKAVVWLRPMYCSVLNRPPPIAPTKAR